MINDKLIFYKGGASKTRFAISHTALTHGPAKSASECYDYRGPVMKE